MTTFSYISHDTRPTLNLISIDRLQLHVTLMVGGEGGGEGGNSWAMGGMAYFQSVLAQRINNAEHTRTPPVMVARRRGFTTQGPGAFGYK